MEWKFRGKSIINNKWVYGYYVYSLGMTGEGSTGHYIVIQGNGNHYSRVEFIEVLPETVGAFTGLTDVKGREIYQGDIVQIKLSAGYGECYSWEKFKIEFIRKNQLGRFIAKDEHGESWNVDGSSEIEVTGNVWEREG